MGDPWVALFSGGKDSSWALHCARERGLPVERLVTVHPPDDSYLYHVPGTELAALAAESAGLSLLEVHPGAFGPDGVVDSAARGDAELAPLEAALAEFGRLGGVVAGAVESEYQATRIEGMCERLDADLFAPLWRRDSIPLLREMCAAGLDARVVAVAAAGLDESWLGRPLDDAAITDLEALSATHGVHPLGEGGEFETLVVDGPHLARRIEFEAEPVWEGDRGHLRITDAWLA